MHAKKNGYATRFLQGGEELVKTDAHCYGRRRTQVFTHPFHIQLCKVFKSTSSSPLVPASEHQPFQDPQVFKSVKSTLDSNRLEGVRADP